MYCRKIDQILNQYITDNIQSAFNCKLLNLYFNYAGVLYTLGN